MSPTISSKKPKPKKSKGATSKKAMEREQFIFLLVLIIGAATVVVHLLFQAYFYMDAGKKYQKEERALASIQTLKAVEQKEKFANELEIVSRAKENDLAYQKRQKEYEERLNMATRYASTETEKNLLAMKKIKNSPDMDPEKALERIAELAVPPRSGYMVEKKSRGFEVTVAFPAKEINKKFSDRYDEYYEGVIREIKRTAAGIMLDLFRFGKPHNIYRVNVMCQDITVVRERGKKDRRETRNTFSVSSRVHKADWENLDRAGVEDVWRVRQNYYD